MTKEEVLDLIRSDESYRIELTASTTDKDKFQEAICAFSNDMPGSRKKGYLLIGVRNNGDIDGLKVDDGLSERCTDSIATFDVMPCREATLDDIDTDFIKEHYLPQAISPETLSEDKRDLKEQMASLRLFSMRYNCPTMAAVILFGRDPRYFLPGDYVQFVKFAGKTKATEVLNERQFKGSLVTLLPRLESFVGDAVVAQRPVLISLFREKTVIQALSRHQLPVGTAFRDPSLIQYEDPVVILDRVQPVGNGEDGFS